MNTKVLAGFVAGALAAFGVAYFANHRPPPVVAAVAVPTTPVAPEPVPAPAPAPAKVVVVKATKKTEPVHVVEVQPPPPEPPAAPRPPTAEPVAAPAPPPPPAPVAPPPPAPEPHSVTLPSGTLISVRLGEALSTKFNRAGDTFSATLDQPLVVNGFAVAERGARLEGRVAEVEEAGRVKGLARLSIELTTLKTSDGQRVAIRTARFEKTGPESKRQDAEKVGIGAVLGTIIGAAAGGGKGAGIGAAAGGAAGAGTVMATRGKPAELPVETRISFRLDQSVALTEQLANR